MTTIFRKILCPVDFSNSSIAALDQAAKLARKGDAMLYLMNVEFVPMSNPAELAHYVTVSTEPGKVPLARIARKHLAKVRHEVLVQVGRPAELIEKAADDLEVDLIVMATHGRRGVARLFLGSIAEHVVRTSTRPVLSISPGTTIGALKKILCPVDFDPKSIAALKFGWRLAQEYRAAINLLHVVAAPFEPSEVPVEASKPEWEREARAQLSEVVAKSLGAQAKCKLLVQSGDPAGAILDVAKELRPDLIVMATHGRSGLSRLVLGSVAGRVVRESTVPVLTVREQSALDR